MNDTERSAAEMSHPAVDLLTDRAAVVLQERPVVPFTSWLADAARLCGGGRGLQVVTPAEARITMPLRLTLSPHPSRWVVRDPDGAGYYDGLTGAVLTWDGSAFDAVEDEEGAGALAEAYSRSPEDPGSQLIVSFRVLHPATEATTLGGAIARACEMLADEPPGGWGTAEPATEPWDIDELTKLCRTRAPDPTWLTFVGGPPEGADPPALGTLYVSRVQTGVEESVQLFLGYPPGVEPPLDRLPDLADRLASRFTLTSMLAQRTTGPQDLTSVPHWVGLPLPVGMLVDPATVRSIEADKPLAPPEVTAHRVGDLDTPAAWFSFGDGSFPDSFENYELLMRHLGVPGPQD